MQLRKTNLWLAALIAAGLCVTACGDDAGGGIASLCSDDGDCDPDTEICNQTAGFCMQKCTSAADCPESNPTCAPLNSGSSQNVCRCASDASCQGDGGDTDVRCDTASGACTNQTGGGGTACTGFGTCATSATTGGQVCTSNTCQTGATCSGSGRSTCSYGQWCNGTACGEVPRPTCANFNPSQGGRTPVWTTSSTGPIIYSVQRVSVTQNYQYCASDAPWGYVVSLRAYRSDSDWPATRDALNGFFYVRVDGAQTDIVGNTLLVPGTGYTRTSGNNRDATFQVYLCRSNAQVSATPNLSAGFYFTGGNEICSTINQN